MFVTVAHCSKEMRQKKKMKTLLEIIRNVKKCCSSIYFSIILTVKCC